MGKVPPPALGHGNPEIALPMVEAHFDRGVFLPAQGIWLDSKKSKSLAFVSHAHSDHTARHDTTVATPATIDLMRLRMGPLKGTLIPLAFGEARDFGSFSIRLIPAGHVLGSAQCLIVSEAGTLLYTGDFKLRKGATSGAAEFCRARTLIMETTFGLPKYVFPPDAEVIAAILDFCRAALAENEVPVLLAYSLGKAQEVLHALTQAGIATMPHPSISRLLPAYERAGFLFPGLADWEPSAASGHVVVCPPNARGPLDVIPRMRTAVITGWALDSSTVYRSQCEAAFPLSDHAGYDDLLRHVENVSPDRVLTLHGFAQEFARDLRVRGIEAWALTGPNQLDLPLF